jgi:two-component sensor histidine kinase
MEYATTYYNTICFLDMFIFINILFLIYIKIKIENQYKLKFIQLKNNEKELNYTIAKKNILLKELNHRTKNNFQILLSLMNIQSRKTNNSKVEEFVSINECRIHAMLATYSQFNGFENNCNNKIEITTYYKDLANKLIDAYSIDESKFKLEIDAFIIDSELAKYLGILLVELVTNSIKHRVNNTSKYYIHISVAVTQPNTITLRYSDTKNTIKKAPLMSSENDNEGISLLKAIVKHINGELIIHPGFVYQIVIKF